MTNKFASLAGPAALGLLALTTTCTATGAAGDAPGPAVALAQGCTPCHTNAPGATAMRDAERRPISPYDLWRSSMMANASRDPFWRAQVAVEIAATPSRADDIAETCLGCHAPLAAQVGLDDHDSGDPLHALSCEEREGELAADGVSCTICHGIAPEGLGEPETWSGRFALNVERRLFGPHDVTFAFPMQRFTGFTPTRAEHVTDAGLCATCHTLETEALRPDGKPAGGGVLEQSPYLEWRNSSFVDEPGENGARGPRAAACQACHVPTRDVDGAPIETRIARNPGGRDFPPTSPRSPFGRHLFVGGNTLVPALFRDHAAELGATASPEAFEATRAAAQDQLERRTARVAIEAPQLVDGTVAFTVHVVNLAGHKLPTGHPSRRAWLRVRVTDAAGRVLFASGATDATGVIVGADGAPLASERAGGPEQPHKDVVRASDEVALYQSVLSDAGGAPTYLLLRGAGYARDDRLLPAGWSAAHPDAARTAPVGVADDADFTGGGDRVRYEIALDGAVLAGPLSIEAELCYQTLSARWLAEMQTFDLPEVHALDALLATADRAPVVLDHDAALLWP